MLCCVLASQLLVCMLRRLLCHDLRFFEFADACLLGRAALSLHGAAVCVAQAVVGSSRLMFLKITYCLNTIAIVIGDADVPMLVVCEPTAMDEPQCFTVCNNAGRAAHPAFVI